MGMMVTMVSSDRLGNAMFVPLDGLVQVFLTEIDPYDLVAGPGRYACLHLGRPTAVHFRASDTTPVNQRAGKILTLLSNFSMRITGPAVFTGIPDGGVYRLIQQLNEEGTPDEV